MKLTLTTDEGVLLNTWEHIEEYDLSKMFAVDDLVNELRNEIAVARARGEK